MVTLPQSFLFSQLYVQSDTIKTLLTADHEILQCTVIRSLVILSFSTQCKVGEKKDRKKAIFGDIQSTVCKYMRML